MNITLEDCEKADALLWDFIYNFRNAENDLEIDEAKEDISMQLIEITNLAFLLGKQTEKETTN